MATHRTRKMTFRLSDEEYNEVCKKVSSAGISQQQYLLDCALNKPVCNTDGLKAIIPEIKRIGNNINQIAKRANSTNLSPDDILEVMRREGELWQLLKQHLQEKAQ